MNGPLKSDDFKKFEHLLKKELAWRMAWIQRDRALNHSSRNVGNASDYVESARTLRRVLMFQGGENIRPLRDMFACQDVPDDVADIADIGPTDSVLDVCQKLHDVGNPHVPPGSMTEHESVPGQPA